MVPPDSSIACTENGKPTIALVDGIGSDSCPISPVMSTGDSG